MSDDEGMTPSKRGSGAGPTRTQSDLADVIEILLEKGVVINADIAVSVGDTELLGVQIRAALASFETAAEYGLEFPTGTDMRRVEAASGREELPDEEVPAEGSAIEADAEREAGSEDEQRDGDEQRDIEGDEQRDADEDEAEAEADGGSPVAPLHRPPVAENAPWLETPPITAEQDDRDDRDGQNDRDDQNDRNDGDDGGTSGDDP